MKGYPKFVATRQDFVNLLTDPDLRSQAAADLRAIRDYDDDTCAVVVSGSEETGDLVTKSITNPKPLWMQKGFETRDEISALLAEYGEEE